LHNRSVGGGVVRGTSLCNALRASLGSLPLSMCRKNDPECGYGAFSFWRCLSELHPRHLPVNRPVSSIAPPALQFVTTSRNTARRRRRLGPGARALQSRKLKRPDAASKECRCELRRAFRNEAIFLLVSICIDCCGRFVGSLHMRSRDRACLLLRRTRSPRRDDLRSPDPAFWKRRNGHPCEPFNTLPC